MKNDNKQEFRINRQGLKPTTKVQSLADAIKEGNELLENETKQPIQCPKNKSVSNSNPYYQARLNILEKYPQWRQQEILTMEKNNNLDNRMYNEFVQEVAEEGDKLSQ